ncbi:MAG TPA: hypothetical protein VF974_04745 [Patescibacteria group bacterium]
MNKKRIKALKQEQTEKLMRPPTKAEIRRYRKDYLNLKSYSTLPSNFKIKYSLEKKG